MILYSGFETVSTTSMMAIKYLHDHSSALQEIRDEHFAIRGRKKPEEPLDWNDHKSMVFTRVERAWNLTTAAACLEGEAGCICEKELGIVTIAIFLHYFVARYRYSNSMLLIQFRVLWVSCKYSGELALSRTRAEYCLSDIEQILQSILSEASCPVTHADEIDNLVDSSNLLASCGNSDAVNERCNHICQNSVSEAARKISVKDYLKMLNVISHWCAACCNVMSYVSHLQEQSLIANLQALNCIALLGIRLQKANVCHNVYDLCQVNLKDFYKVFFDALLMS
ncbi:hypothetical protein RHSIM_Rhsim04G0053500 [Rhododendron simsii]|uniref:At1g61900-like C-terminal domain-containing protein n=1 Tax=Rhododendron simsii TaxID=118357 RepID=A0A834H3I0_RHOSS|nr:hypothetical protein RHSIM_Rhsim04G0053500 [Rhododendron simsii]